MFPFTLFGKPPAGERFTQANPPGQAPGILAWLKQTVGGWVGPTYARGTPLEEELTREKARAGPALVNIPAFLPYFLDETGETLGMRRWYRRFALVEPIVKACLLDKVLDVASLDFHVNPADDTGKSPQQIEKDKEVAAFHQWNLTRRVEGGIPGLVWSVCFGALVDGYSVCGKVRQPQDEGRYRNKIVLHKLKPKDVDNDLILEIDEYRNVVGVIGLRYNSGEVFSPQDFTIAQYMPTYEKPGGNSDCRAIYSAAWMLDTVRKLRMIGVEKRSLPVLHGTFRDLAQKPSLDAALAGLKISNFLSSPESIQLKAIEIAGQSHEIYLATIGDLKQDIAIGLVGAYLQMMGASPGAQRGDTAQHRATADLVKWFLMYFFLEVVNRQIIPEFTDLNYVGVDYPEAVMGGIDEASLSTAATVDAQLQKMGLPMSKRAMYKKYGREAPRDPDDVLTPPAPAPGGGFMEYATAPLRLPAANGNGHAAAGVAAEPFCETDWGYRFRR